MALISSPSHIVCYSVPYSLCLSLFVCCRGRGYSLYHIPLVTYRFDFALQSVSHLSSQIYPSTNWMSSFHLLKHVTQRLQPGNTSHCQLPNPNRITPTKKEDNIEDAFSLFGESSVWSTLPFILSCVVDREEPMMWNTLLNIHFNFIYLVQKETFYPIRDFGVIIPASRSPLFNNYKKSSKD